MLHYCWQVQALRAFLLSSVILVASLVSASAQAHGFTLDCVTCGTWLPIGVNVGGLSRVRDSDINGAFIIGAEASLLSISEHRTGEHDGNRHWGAYIDTVYETHDRIFRSSAGPELLIFGKSLPIGFDAGPLIEWRGSHSDVGLRGRAFIPLLFFIPYIGTSFLAFGEQSFTLEAGILLKAPIMVHDHS